ncbi:MAG TPA: NAD-dependent epimerase/dehydratase family protein [Actinomycetaceae bacterium]|nr:NAD-dependent epimerase/dehydratase family protein [Actinomycetaceae bacterium]
MSRVLVTGASGMLGAATARRLQQAGHTVTTFQRSATPLPGVREVRGTLHSDDDVARAVQGHDAVVHLAAKVSVSGAWSEYVATNIEGTRRLLRAARAAGVGTFVHVSSPSVAHSGSSIVGEGAGAADPDLARGNYARSKAVAELEVLAADGPTMATTALRPHLVWGPGDTQLVERILDRARSRRLPLLDAGGALIDSIYVDNAADAIVAGLERIAHVGGQALVITNAEPRPVGDLLAGICLAGGVLPPTWALPAWLARLAGSIIEGLWEWRPGADEPPMTRFLAEQLSTAHWFDQRRAQDLLAWQPLVSIDEGLGRLAAHYGGTAPARGAAVAAGGPTGKESRG